MEELNRHVDEDEHVRAINAGLRDHEPRQPELRVINEAMRVNELTKAHMLDKDNVSEF